MTYGKKIIAIEGIDASGKSKQSRLLKHYLAKRGINARIISHKNIRSLLEFPFLKDEWIIADRYLQTLTVYFTYVKKQKSVSDMLLKYMPRPICTIYLDIPVEESVRRLAKRNKPLEKYEDEESLRLFSRGFQQYHRENHEKVYVVNAMQSRNAIHRDICEIVDRILWEEEKRVRRYKYYRHHSGK